MGWIESVRKKPKEERVRIIWIFVIIAAAFLIILWIATWGYKKSAPKDTTLFDAAAKSFQDAKDNFKPLNK